MVCSKFNSHVYKLNRLPLGMLQGNIFVSILLLGAQKGASIGGAQCSKKIDDGPMNTNTF